MNTFSKILVKLIGALYIQYPGLTSIYHLNKNIRF
ncbi:MAG: hypothetical protein K0S06_4489 [Microvirga sp.]|nr:hypothetical protein [Microvirga sp.]